MKRNVTEVLERSFRNALGNWPLLLLKLAETLIASMVVLIAIVASIVPVAISLGLKDWKAATPDDAVELVMSVLTTHWPLLILILAVLTLAFTIVVALISFAEAGNTLVLIDGERRAVGVTPPKQAFAAFSMDRWLQGGKEHWWSVFWIYNIAWTAGMAVLLIPLILTLVAVFAMRGAGEESVGAIVAGCGGLAFTLLIAIFVTIVVTLWVRKAVVVTVARQLGAMPALREAWAEVMRDFLRHFAVTFVLMALSFGISGAISVFSMIGRLDRTGMASIAMLPMQLGLSVISGAIGAAITLWLVAAFVSLTMEEQ